VCGVSVGSDQQSSVGRLASKLLVFAFGTRLVHATGEESSLGGLGHAAPSNPSRIPIRLIRLLLQARSVSSSF